MKIHQDTSIDHLSIDLRDEVEAKSVYEDGLIIRYDEMGGVIGVDITDSMQFLANSDLLAFVCESLGESEASLREKIQGQEAAAAVADAAGPRYDPSDSGSFQP